jgi:hypothetical protein
VSEPTETLREALEGLRGWLSRHLERLVHVPVKDERGYIVNGFAAAQIPDWDIKQRLSEINELLAAHPAGVEADSGINAELLAAAKAFISWADDCWGSWAISETTPETLAQYHAAKEAIAKAEHAHPAGRDREGERQPAPPEESEGT